MGDINERVPSIIEEAEEHDELGESTGPKDSEQKVGEEEDFDFEVPDKLKI